MVATPTSKLYKKILFSIHDFIHSSSVGSEISIINAGKIHKMELQTNSKGLKFVTFDGITFIEQDKNSSTVFGIIAKNGIPITWGKRHSVWFKLVGNYIYEDGKRIK